MKRLVLAALLVLAAGGVAVAAGPGARCEALQLGKRTVVRVELLRFFDKELLRLVRLGLEGRVRVSFTLMRRRTAWFDDVVLRLTQESTLTWDGKRRRYLLDGVAIDAADLDPLSLARVTLGRRDRDTAGTHYVEVSVRLQVVTTASLLTAAGWLTGGDRDTDAVSRQVARAVADDLVRKAGTSCSVKRGTVP